MLRDIIIGKMGKSPDCIFASPPWGGMQYLKKDLYDLEKHLQPVPLSKLLSVFFSITRNVVLFLPRNSDLDQLSQITYDLLGPEAKCKVVYTKQNGYMKGIHAFWGTPFYDFSQYYPESQSASEDDQLDVVIEETISQENKNIDKRVSMQELY